MPVMVTHAQSAAGRAAVRALRRSGGELRVWLDAEVATDDDAAAFRGLGCKVAVGAMDDEGRLEVAFEQVHTVVHVGGDPLQEPETVLDDAASVLSAAISAGCRRLVWPSHIGAGDPRGNAYLEVCAEVEDLLAEAPLETIVLRRALTYGPEDPLTGLLVSGAPTEAMGARPTARHEPLYVEDLAAAIVSADAMDRGPRRGAPAAADGLQVVVELVGPEVVRLEDLVRILGGPIGADPRRSRRARAAGDTRTTPGPAPAHLVDLLSRDLLGAEGALGRGGTPLAVGAASL